MYQVTAEDSGGNALWDRETSNKVVAFDWFRDQIATNGAARAHVFEGGNVIARYDVDGHDL